MPTAACHACGQLTPWTCIECGKPTCASCQNTNFAMCQPCRAAMRGEINVLQKRSDAFIWAEFDRMFV